MKNLWIGLAAISAIAFGLGDFIVVYSESKKIDVVTLYILYTILIGLMNLAYVILFRRETLRKISSFDVSKWMIVVGLCVTYLIAYLLHFVAIQQATNPGYANALVMFHVVVLTLLSYWFLSKPLGTQSVIGIALMFIGGLFITLGST